MPGRQSVTISLTPHLLAVAEGFIAAGRHETISEGMRAARRGLEEREIDFRAYKAANKRLGSPALQAAEASC